MDGMELVRRLHKIEKTEDIVFISVNREMVLYGMRWLEIIFHRRISAGNKR